MSHQSLFDKAVVIKFLRENEALTHSKAAELLNAAGIVITRVTVSKIRRENHINYSPAPSAKDIVEQWHRAGKQITVDLLKQHWPAMTTAYAQRLVATYAPVKRDLNKRMAVEVAPVEVKEQPFLITRVGAVTRYELR